MPAPEEAPTSPEDDFHIVRLLASVEAIPDPVERVRQCVVIGDQVRALQGRLGEIRRRAVYEATLKPGATGRSVAAALGVSTKAVSQASSEYRQTDLALLDRTVDVLSSALSPNDPDINQLLALRASTRSVSLIAQALLRTYRAWLDLVAKDDDVPDEVRTLDEAYERAEYLCALAEIKPTATVRFPTLAVAEPRYDDVPDELLWPAKILNAMPGIIATACNYTYEDRVSEWSLQWQILPAERYTSVFDAGPDPQGWAVSEWLVWLARDFQRSGAPIHARVTSPPPYLNEPGESMAFIVEGETGTPESVSAVDFADTLMRVWDGTDSGRPAGYFEVKWPEREAAE
ncbi:hypothetical protein ACFWQC_01030 [Nocardioides sp. NPDC058538]|uniref:hypothetical protein n=1 Tax=Nocardioides sp. NPDC058538 TaxID=3346542 RepID=UPI00364ED2CA